MQPRSVAELQIDYLDPVCPFSRVIGFISGWLRHRERTPESTARCPTHTNVFVSTKWCCSSESLPRTSQFTVPLQSIRSMIESNRYRTVHAWERCMFMNSHVEVTSRVRPHWLTTQHLKDFRGNRLGIPTLFWMMLSQQGGWIDTFLKATWQKKPVFLWRWHIFCW